MDVRKHTDVIRELVALGGARVLDVGCGDGALTRFLAREGAHATGIEVSAAALVRARFAQAVADETFVEGAGERLPFPDASVDAVIYMNALHHVPIAAHADAIAEAARVLKTGGALLVLEPLARGAYFELVRAVEDETEVREAAYRAIGRADQAGFQAVAEVVYDAPLKFADFAALEARIVAVDPRRAPIVARLRETLQRGFAAAGRREADGIHFSQPTRANLLVKAGSL